MTSRRMTKTSETGIKLPLLYDRLLILATLGLIAIGLLMVASSSMMIAERSYQQPLYFLYRQLIYVVLGMGGALAIFRIEVRFWQRINPILLIVSFVLLLLVLIPGIGRQVNGSIRWIMLGPVSIQVSELAKVFIITYLAGYLQRHQQEVQRQMSGFIKPMVIVSSLCLLLLLEPDFGAAVVLLATTMGLFFIAGVRIRYFLILILVVITGLAGLAYLSPYRLERITAFLHPWANQFGSGYQLTQALIAFGRGGWFGVGLGDSVQKLFYLPEAHTDFLFAVLAEELGFVGAMLVIVLFLVLVVRALFIGRAACQQKNLFAGYVAYGLGLCLAFESIINMGVNAGLLPTKGLTLPFISYGGSSLLSNCIIVALLLRIDHENRINRWKK